MAVRTGGRVKKESTSYAGAALSQEREGEEGIAWPVARCRW